MKLSDLIHDCLMDMGKPIKGYSPRTLETYEAVYQDFRKYLQLRNLPNDVDSFTGEIVEGYADELLTRKYKARTVNKNLAALSKLGDFGMKRRLTTKKYVLDENPTKRFDWPRITEDDMIPTPKLLHADELAAVEAVPLKREDEGLARALLIETGMRASEVCGLTVGDLREIEPDVWVVYARVKSRGARRVVPMPLSRELASAINGRLDQTERRANPKNPLVVNGLGEAYKRTALSQFVARLGRKAGVDRFRLSSHKLRHTVNTINRVGNVSDFTRSRLLGHADPKSLRHYEHELPGELQEMRAQTQAARAAYLATAFGHAPTPELEPFGNGDRNGAA